MLRATEAKTVAPAHVPFSVEPIPAKVEAKTVALARARFWTEPIRAAERILYVRQDVTAADHIGAAIRCVSVVDRNCAAIPCARDDSCRDLHHGLASNAAYPLNRATACCARFPASFAPEPEFAQPFGIRCHAPGDPGE